jgi:hypothetical protein
LSSTGNSDCRTSLSYGSESRVETHARGMTVAQAKEETCHRCQHNEQDVTPLFPFEMGHEDSCGPRAGCRPLSSETDEIINSPLYETVRLPPPKKPGVYTPLPHRGQVLGERNHLQGGIKDTSLGASIHRVGWVHLFIFERDFLSRRLLATTAHVVWPHTVISLVFHEGFSAWSWQERCNREPQGQTAVSQIARTWGLEPSEILPIHPLSYRSA